MLKSVLVCVGLFTSTLTFSQAQVDTLVQLLNKHQLKFPLEKVYLHLDRPHYAPGDTLWLKAYLTEGDSHLADSVSKNLYVDFIKKENGKVVEHLTLRNEGSYAAGAIAIADTVKEGVYEVIAYTQWMRNFSETNFFRKDIFIRKKYETKNQPTEAEIASRMDVAELQFFPEGGNLVAGMQNRVAFKAVNKFGLGTDFKAFVISSHHDTVASIQTQHLGMGSFIFKPNASEKYYAVIGKVTSKKFALPEPIVSGYTFFVDNLSNKNTIKVIARNNFPVKDRPLLIGHLRGIAVIAFQSKTEGNSFTWALPKSDIGENGIVQLTLFNANGVPQCERLIYNKAKAPISVSILSNKTAYAPNEKVNLSIHVQDTSGNPLQGNFSLAVTDTRQVGPDVNGSNIYNYFYLTSDVQSLGTGEVKGTIEQPDYYFTSSDLNAVVHLDMLLLTQGWRKFLWSDIVEGKENPTSFEIEQAITVKGKALLFSGKPISKPASISLMYVNPLGDMEYLNTKTDNNGRFAFNLPEVKENTQAFIQGQKEKGGRNLKFELENKELPKYKTTPQLIDPFFFDSQRWNLFLEQQAHLADMDAKLRQVKAKMLKEVVITRKREEIKPDRRKTFYQGSNATTLKIENTMCSGISNVLQMLQSRVAGLQISLGRNGDYVASIRNKVPVILVDGMRYDLSMISTVWPCDVESIDIVTGPVLTLNAPCLISILTKQANPNYDFSKDVALGTLVTTIQGYRMSREFYNPKYPVTNSLDPLPDFRATLYWNPSIKTDAQGNAKVTFWNSDEHTIVQAQLEGMTKEGKPGFATYNYTVK